MLMITIINCQENILALITLLILLQMNQIKVKTITSVQERQTKSAIAATSIMYYCYGVTDKNVIALVNTKDVYVY